MHNFIKALVLAVTLVLGVAFSASALTVAWDHDLVGDPAGYTLYWQKTDGTGLLYNKTIDDVAIKQVDLDDGYFEPGTSYTFTATAFNGRAESAHSEELVYVIPEYKPPVDHLPAILFLLLDSPNKPSIL